MHKEIKPSTDISREKQLQAILYLLQSNIEDFKNEVDSSYELLRIGEKTELTRQLEQTITNPLDVFFRTSANIQQQTSSILDNIITQFIRTEKGILDKAKKIISNSNALNYALVLKEDTTDHRAKFFGLLDRLDLMNADILQQNPVNFIFTSHKLIDKFLTEKEIELA